MLDDWLSPAGEKLHNIEEQLDAINEDMKSTEKTLNQMDKFLGIFKLPKFGRKKVISLVVVTLMTRVELQDKVKPSDELWKAQPSEDKMDRIAKSRAGQSSSAASSVASGRIIQRIADDAREDEMEENMQVVDKILGNLKNMALDMGTEIDSQNKVLDRLTYKTEEVDQRIERADQRIRKKL